MVMIGIFSDSNKEDGREIGVPFEEFPKVEELFVRIRTQLAFGGLCAARGGQQLQKAPPRPVVKK